MKQFLNKKPNEHKIPAITVSYHSTRLVVYKLFFKKKVLYTLGIGFGFKNLQQATKKGLSELLTTF